MSALPPKADICSALPHVRFVPQTVIPTCETITTFGAAMQRMTRCANGVHSVQFGSLLQSRLSHAFKELGHWARLKRDVLLDPRNRDVGLQFLQSV